MIVAASIIALAVVSISFMWSRFAQAKADFELEHWFDDDHSADAADPYQLTEDHIDHSHKDHI